MRPLLARSLLLLVAFGLIVFFGDAAKRGRQQLREQNELVGHVPGAEPASSSSGHAEPKARGGRLQRARHREEDAKGTTADPPLANPLNDNLKIKWAKGKITSKDIQEIAQDAQTQGAHGLNALSGAGFSGKHAQNLFRDLVKIFGRPVGAPELDWILIPTQGNRQTPHSVYWPHKFFAKLYSDRPDI